MKFWLEEKRTNYLLQIIQMKAGPQDRGTNVAVHGQTPCPRCHLGRPVWRCLDCTDSRAVCVLCCRNDHRNNLFHRIEKWNGRFYQKGALWQVGVKLFTGHNGEPCPGSSAALGLPGRRPRPGVLSLQPNQDVAAIALRFGKTELEIYQTISDCLEHPLGTWTEVERDITMAVAENSGKHVLDFLKYIKAAISGEAEEEASAIQVDADRTTAIEETAVPVKPKDHHIPEGIPLEEDLHADDEWEDEDARMPKGNLPRFLPQAPPSDGAGNPFITLVHTNGFHALPVVWCTCPEHLEDRDFQLLDLHLYPASFDRIKTVFTFACLDDHRYEYLECKSSHYQYHNKLRRLTCAVYPNAAPNRYAELVRVARQWRNLKYRRWFWQLNNLNSKRGAMALFCPACPQPGVNLEPGWKAESDENP